MIESIPTGAHVRSITEILKQPLVKDSPEELLNTDLQIPVNPTRDSYSAFLW